VSPRQRRLLAAIFGTVLLACCGVLLQAGWSFALLAFLALGLVSWVHFFLWKRERLRHWISAVCMLLLGVGALQVGPAFLAAPWLLLAAVSSAARASGWDVPAFLS